MNNRMLAMHHMAREARPTHRALCMIGAHYRGVRFRLSEHRATPRSLTYTWPVIEVLTEVRGVFQWVLYQVFEPGRYPVDTFGIPRIYPADAF